MARPDSSIRVNILIIWALSGYYPDAACRSPYRRGGMITAPVGNAFGHTIPLLMISAYRTECGDPDQPRKALANIRINRLCPASLASFISPVVVTVLL